MEDWEHTEFSDDEDYIDTKEADPYLVDDTDYGDEY
jgi:hypothetical protein